jgi:hypothetical protein
MEEWYSGLVPHGPLLAAQIVIVFVDSRICLGFTRGYGFFIRPRKGSPLG